MQMLDELELSREDTVALQQQQLKVLEDQHRQIDDLRHAYVSDVDNEKVYVQTRKLCDCQHQNGTNH